MDDPEQQSKANVEQAQPALAAYIEEPTPENLEVLAWKLIPSLKLPSDYASMYYNLQRDLIFVMVPVAYRTVLDFIARKGLDPTDSKSMGLRRTAIETCLGFICQMVVAADRTLVGGRVLDNALQEVLAKHDRQNRFKLHKLIQEGMSEGKALKQIFPDDSSYNRRRFLKDWKKDDLWPLTEKEFEELKSELDS